MRVVIRMGEVRAKLDCDIIGLIPLFYEVYISFDIRDCYDFKSKEGSNLLHTMDA